MLQKTLDRLAKEGYSLTLGYYLSAYNNRFPAGWYLTGNLDPRFITSSKCLFFSVNGLTLKEILENIYL